MGVSTTSSSSSHCYGSSSSSDTDDVYSNVWPEFIAIVTSQIIQFRIASDSSWSSDYKLTKH